MVIRNMVTRVQLHVQGQQERDRERKGGEGVGADEMTISEEEKGKHTHWFQRRRLQSLQLGLLSLRSCWYDLLRNSALLLY